MSRKKIETVFFLSCSFVSCLAGYHELVSRCRPFVFDN